MAGISPVASPGCMSDVVVGVDILFFRHHFWERLIVNLGIVLADGG